MVGNYGGVPPHPPYIFGHRVDSVLPISIHCDLSLLMYIYVLCMELFTLGHAIATMPWEIDNARLCAREHRLRLESFPIPALNQVGKISTPTAARFETGTAKSARQLS